MPRIAVIGAGIVGMSTAVQILEQVPGAVVTVIAEQLMEETTTYGAAGIFRPIKEKFPSTPMPTLRRWVAETWRHIDGLAHSPDSGQAGVQILSGYHMFNEPREDPLYKDVVYNFRNMTEKELAMFPGPKYKYGWFVTTILTEGKVYLKYMSDRFRRNGGTTEKRKISNLGELVGKYDLVVNCSGLGSYELANDKRVIPIRGHLIKVKAPWLKHFVYTGEKTDCYILPCSDAVGIGGSWQYGDYGLTPREDESKAIWDRACAVLPSLKNSEILMDWVGLRPYRDPLRVETEIMTFSSGKLKVVHHYGHGGEGIAFSWPTATDATKLVKELLAVDIKSKL